MKPMIKIAVVLALTGVVALAAAGCADKTEADPTPVAFNVGFPSTSAAIAVEDVRIYVYEGADPGTCNDTLTKLLGQQPLPTPATLIGPMAPCDLLAKGGATADLHIGASYTMVGVANRNGQPFLAGCIRQTNFGNEVGLDVPLGLIATDQRVEASKCAKLSLHCSGGC